MLGLLALTMAAADVHSALTITPAAHDFGSVIVRMTGTTFQFQVTLPTGGAATDSIVIGIIGANPADFRANANVVNACQDPTWRTGSCVVMVEFIPQGEGVRSATLVVADTRGNRGTASITGTGIFGCRPTASSPCDYAGNYSGTFDWSSMLVTSSGMSSGAEYKGRAVVSVRVSIIGGVAVCTGAMSDSTASLTAGRMDEMRKIYGDISGPGIFSVEFVKEDGQLVYKLKAWCPTAKGTSIATVFQPGSPNVTTTGTFEAKPAKVGASGGMTSDSEPAAKIGIDLTGTSTIVQPDADPLNGVTGTLTRSWSLKRG